MQQWTVANQTAHRPGAPLCPNCGFPMESSDRFCFHCRRFVDLRQNRVRLPGEAADQELENLRLQVKTAWERSKHSREQKMLKRGKRLLVAGAIMICTLILAAPGFFLLLMGMILINNNQDGSPEKLDLEELEAVLDDYLVPSVLAFGFDQVLEYCHDKCIPAQEIHRGQLMQQAYNQVTGSDYIRAVYRGLPVVLGDLQLENSQQNALGISRGKPVFRGTMLLCALGIRLPEPVTIWEREGQAAMGEGVPTGNREFDRQFYVESRHPQTARALLGPRLVESILRLDRLGGGNTTLKFLEDGTLYVAIASPRDLFELQSMEEPVADLRKRFYEELYPILKLLAVLAEARDRMSRPQGT